MALVATVLLVSGLVSGLFIVKELRKPEPISDYTIGDRSTETIVVIPEGATGDEIAQILFDAQVVKSPRAFFAAATGNPESKLIQPGTYKINRKISGAEAVFQLLDRKRRVMGLLIKEGERSYELYEKLHELKYDKKEIAETFSANVSVSEFGSREFEGFIFPATYNLVPGESLNSIRNRILSKFNEVITEIDFVRRALELNLNPYDALIIASIVQAEGFDERDFGKVARVIYNRMEIGMPLQMDSTVLYALKERRIAVTNKDININSQYNTYNRKGLPPTPIGNPGKKALEATLTPDAGDWLYFVTVAPTETKFTKSYDEFLTFKREFQRNLKAGLFDGKS